MWKMSGQPKVVSVTPQLAKKFRDMAPAPGDRPLRDRRVEALKKEVVDKKFRTCEWASAYCVETKQTYRVNGKHTSTLMAELNGEAKGVSIVVEHYYCDTLDDVARLYATFDTRGSIRSTGDINAAFARACPPLIDVPLRIINVAVTGMSIAVWGDIDVAAKSTPEQRASLLEPNSDFVLWLGGMLTTGDEGMLRRGPVAAAMFQTYQKDKKAASEFWELVRDASGPKHTSPDRRLNKILLTCSVAAGQARMSANVKSSAGGGTLISRRELRVKCIHAWNAWRRGATTELRYYANADDPKVI